MKSAVLAAVVLAVGVAAQGPTINTPTTTNPANECQPFLIQWSGGTPPWFVTVQNSPPSGTPVADFGQTTATQVTWTVNATVGTQLLFQIRDSTGTPQSSAPFGVTAGSGDSCLTAGGGGSSPGSSTPGTGESSTPPSTPASSTGGGSSVGGGGSTKPTSSGAPGASNSTKPSSATGLSVPAGVLPACAAVLGAAFVALLA